MTDLASLGLRIESQEAELADRRLDSFEASAQRAESATDSLAAAARGLGSALIPTLTSIDASVRELLELQRIQQGVVGASAQQVAATQAVAKETAEATAAVSFYGASFRTTQASMGGAAAAAKEWGAAVAQADAHVLAYRQHMGSLPPVIGQADAHMVAYRNQIGRVGSRLQLTAQDGLNFSRQMADIGVTAAMGMNPLMIALQQGPQLFDILQMTAMRSGMTIRATMAATGAVVWTTLAPLLPLIAAITAAGALVFSGFSLSARAARESAGDLTVGMGLTEDQMKRLKDEGVETGVTVGDVFRGLGTTIKEGFFAVFGDQIDWLGRKWDEAMDALWRGMIWVTKQIVGGFLGAFYAIRDTWRMIPAVLGDAAITAANAVLRAIESMINGGVRLLNGLIEKANAASARMGMRDLIPELDEARITRLENQYAGAMREFGAQVGRSFGQGMADASAGVDRVASRLVENIIASGQARIRAAAGDAEEGRSGTGGRSRPDREVQKLEAFRRPAIQDLRASMPQVDEALPFREIADELRLIDELARDAARGMASAFGEAGRAMGDLLTVMSGYESRLAEIALAQKEGRITEAQAIREQAHAQVQSYGDMAAAARGFFQEGSAGYRALLAIEQVYRAYQMAASIQAMAQGWIETSSSIAQSGAKGTASMAAGAAKMFEMLGPLGFPAVAAMLGLLAGLGLKGSGGGGGKQRGYGDDEGPDHSTNAVRSYTAQDAAARDQVTTAIASKVEVRVTADREGLNAYVARTAQKEAFGVAAPMVAAAAAGTKRDVMDTLNARQVGNRKISV